MCDPDRKDLYEVLGGKPYESVQQLRQKYLQLALQYHPDRQLEQSSSESECVKQKFLEVEEAWRILSDGSSRRQYDLQRRAQQLQQDSPLDCTVNLEEMTWDADECVYTHVCRCGGAFNISEEEVEEETRRIQQQGGDEEEEVEEGGQRGVVLCCDTCSLSVYITWLKDRTTIPTQ